MKKVFIFDLNGTLVDDMKFHQEAWYHVLRELGAQLSYEEVIHELYGKDEELLSRIFARPFVASDVEVITEKVEKRYQDTVRNRLQPIEGLLQFLHTLKAKNKIMAIGTGASPLNTEFILNQLNIENLFDAIVKADDVSQGKPHPETYLKISSQLDVTPSACVVFEDAPSGAEAAIKAGMDCVVITTLHSPEQFSLNSEVKFFIHDYNDARLQTLL
ncbi:MAG TPA: HAD family phosphatase [Cyclobacteriaceae bacterium]|nr:HAD family phosphatase [Cyclobacteriaceae bacterium]